MIKKDNDMLFYNQVYIIEYMRVPRDALDINNYDPFDLYL